MTITVLELYEGRAVGIERILRREDVRYSLLRAYGEEIPSLNHPAILSGGSPSLLDLERFPYLRTVLNYVADAISFGTPILGICLGHQVLAKALGGEVGLSERPEYGFHYVEHAPHDLTKGIESPFLVFQYHQDEILSLPSNTEVFSSNDNTKIQGFVVRNKKIYGIQYHPEVDLALAKKVLQNLPPHKLNSATPISTLTNKDILGDKIVTNFMENL